MNESSERLYKPPLRVRILLEPGEIVLWSGSAHPRLSLDSPAKFWASLIGFVVAALFLAITFSLTDEAPGFPLVTFGENTLAATIILLIGSLLVVQLLRWIDLELADSPVRLDRSTFVLSDRRAFVMEEELDARIRQVRIDSLSSIQTRVFDNGLGTIACTSRDPDSWFWSYSGHPALGHLFWNISDPAFVHDLIVGLPCASCQPRFCSIACAWEERARSLLGIREPFRWSARPRQKLPNFRADLGLSLYALPFLILPIVFVQRALESRDPRREGIGAASDEELAAVIAIGVLSAMAGLYLLAFRFIARAWWRRHTGYGLNGNLAIVSSPGIVRSVTVQSMTAVSLSRNAGRWGTIACTSEAMECRIGVGNHRWTWRRPLDGPLFHDIEFPEQVLDRLNEPQHMTTGAGDSR
jgi:hypothetical protein